VDGSGYVYVTGTTDDGTIDFPTTTDAYEEIHNDNDNYYSDVFVVKLDPTNLGTGNGLLYSTFLGGSGNDYGYGIALDGSGNVYVTGRTNSSDFPTFPNPGAYDVGPGTGAFVTKLSPTNLGAGNGLLYSTLLVNGGGNSIAVDGSGDVYVTGWAVSGFPTTTGAYDETYNGSVDAFVAKLTLSGGGSSDLLYSTYLGGSSIYGDYGNGIAVDGSGDVYVTGSCGTGFPTTPGAYDDSHSGESDVFVTKLDPTNLGTGNGLLYSTFLGGSGGQGDYGYGIAVDGSGNAYVTGWTGSSNFPTTTGAFDESYNGGPDAFVTKLNTTGTALEYSTFLGGNAGCGCEVGYAIAVDGAGDVYVTGYTGSNDFPTTPDAYDDSRNAYDVFVTKLDPTNLGAGNGLLYSTYIGGERDEWGYGIAVDGSENVYVTGYTQYGFISNFFPTTTGAYDESFDGGEEVYVFKMATGCVENDTGQIDVQGVSGGSGDTINVAVRIQNAPNLVKFFDFDLVYDTSLLTFTGNSTRGGLTKKFDTLIVYEASFGTISVIGFEGGSDTIAGSASGDVVLLEFTMQSCTTGKSLGTGYPTDLMYDISGWTTSRGCLLCTTPPITTCPPCYRDVDDDGYGDKDDSISNACTLPSGYVRNKTDCDDSDPDIYPGAEELCNGVDDDCNGRVDEIYEFRRIKRVPRKISFGVAVGGTVCKEFRIKRKHERKGKKDYRRISWEIVKDDCSWLTLTPPTGTIGLGLKKTTVEACVDATGLEKGKYKCVLTITDTTSPCPISPKDQKTMKVIVNVR
jgi:hypothetical protein